jgi:hypothetical protein
MCVPAVESISCPGARGVRTVQQENMACPIIVRPPRTRSISPGAGSIARSLARNHKQPRTYRPSIRGTQDGLTRPVLFLDDTTPREFRFPAHFFWLPSGVRVDRDGNHLLTPAKEGRSRSRSEGMRLSVRMPQCNKRPSMPPARVRIT